MCRVPVQLRESVKQRLAAAAEEIFELLERTIAEYEEQLVSKYEQRLRQGALFSPAAPDRVSPVGAAESGLCERPLLRAPPEAPPPIKRHARAPPLLRQRPRAPPLLKQHPEDPPLLKQHPEDPPLLKQHPEDPPLLKQHPEDPPLFKQHPEDPPLFKQHPEDPPLLKQHPEDPPLFKQHPEDPLHLKQEQEALDITARVCEEVKSEELSEFEASGVFPPTDQQEALSHDAWTEVSLDVDSDPADGAASLSPPGGAKGRKRRIHECPLCCLRFQSSFNLETHLRVHTGERPFSCSVCGKTFNRKDSLNNHRKIHAGETFCCGECGKRYSDKSNLRRHVLSTHGAREARPVHSQH